MRIGGSKDLGFKKKKKCSPAASFAKAVLGVFCGVFVWMSCRPRAQVTRPLFCRCDNAEAADGATWRNSRMVKELW